MHRMADLYSKILFPFVLLFHFPANTNEYQISFSALEYAGAVQQDRQGIVDVLLKDLSEKSNIEHQYNVISSARGAKDFLEKKSHCLIPSSVHPPYFKGLEVIHSSSLLKVRYIAFSQSNQAIVNDMSQLSGKVIGVIRDNNTWNYQQRLAIEYANYVEVSNTESLVKLLNNKQIDIAIHDIEDFLSMSRQLNLPAPNYNQNFPIAIDNVVITCHKSEKTQAYLKQINPHIKELVGKELSDHYQRIRQSGA